MGWDGMFVLTCRHKDRQRKPKDDARQEIKTIDEYTYVYCNSHTNNEINDIHTVVLAYTQLVQQKQSTSSQSTVNRCSNKFPHSALPIVPTRLFCSSRNIERFTKSLNADGTVPVNRFLCSPR